MVDGYPSTIDLLYEVATILEERNALSKPFTSKSMMKEVNTRVGGKDLEENFQQLAKEGWLSQAGESFTLIKHPWQETNVTS